MMDEWKAGYVGQLLDRSVIDVLSPYLDRNPLAFNDVLNWHVDSLSVDHSPEWQVFGRH
jgi:hypothetical protein